MGYSFSKPEKNFGERFPVLYKSRYCDQENFEIAAFSSEYNGKDICLDKPVLLSSFDTKENLPSKITKSSDRASYKSRVLERKFKSKSIVYSIDSKSVGTSENLKSVGVGGDIYLLYQNLFGRRVYSTASCYKPNSVKMFSSATKRWKSLPELSDTKEFFCICSFLQNLYLIGNVCMYYDKHINKWKSIAVINESREDTACTVFEGKIIVSGGFTIVQRHITTRKVLNNTVGIFKSLKSNSVEAYDYHENKWTSFPSMLSQRINHTALSIGNKMFIIGGSSDYPEVFDSVTRKFTYIENWPKIVRTSEVGLYHSFEPSLYFRLFQTVSIGYKIYIFKEENNKVNIHCYDVRNNLFSFETSMESKKIDKVSYVKFPMT